MVWTSLGVTKLLTIGSMGLFVVGLQGGVLVFLLSNCDRKKGNRDFNFHTSTGWRNQPIHPGEIPPNPDVFKVFWGQIGVK